MNLILTAGLPASGKSRFAAYAGQELRLPVLVKDDFKEPLFDTVGFRNHEEKRRLDAAATQVMYRCARMILDTGASVILDNNFEERSRSELEALLEYYGCKAVTVLFAGDIPTIFARYQLRDRDPKRHRGHVVDTCYPEAPGMAEHEEEVTLQLFERKFRARGMIDFSIGDTLVVDTTDFGRVSYPDILNWLKSHME